MTQEISEFWKSAWRDFEQDITRASHAPGACLEFIRSIKPDGLTELGGGEWKCLSPFRTEKTASFWIYPDDRGWHDFGTSEAGDLVAFAKRYYGTTNWSETLSKLAEVLRLESWEDRKRRLAPGSGPSNGASIDEVIADMLARWNGDFVEEDRVFEACTWLAQRAHEMMPSQVREHLRERALTDEMIDGEKIGYVQEGFWQCVTDPATHPPFTKKELLATGWFHLHSSRPNSWSHEEPEGRISEAFSGRIVMHYWRDGKARYSIGRKWYGRGEGTPEIKAWEEKNPWAAGKYKKLPIQKSDKRPYVSRFIKNDVLWGEDCLRRARGQVLCITEGIVDAMILKMLGYFVISPVTISFAQHDIDRVLQVLNHVRPEQIVIVNDTDVIYDIRTKKQRQPGFEGAIKMAKTLWKHKFIARIASLPKPGHVAKIDVNDFVRSIRDAA